MNAETVTIIDLLRHGEPEGGKRYRGSLDDPLSEAGWVQMRNAVKLLRHPWQAIVSSPLRRCAAFAAELAGHQQLPLELEPGLREMSFGAWEGQTSTEIMAAAPDALARFWRDPIRHPPPGGENLLDCSARVVDAWQKIFNRYAGQHILLVGHGGTIRLVLCHVLEIPLRRIWRVEIPYANISRIIVYGRGAEAHPSLLFHGQGVA